METLLWSLLIILVAIAYVALWIIVGAIRDVSKEMGLEYRQMLSLLTNGKIHLYKRKK